MKKNIIFLSLLVTSTALAQNTPWSTTNSIGIGTTSPNSNLHVHGTTDYSVNYPAIPGGFYGSGDMGSPAYTEYFGKTSRIKLSNTTVGSTTSDGANLRLSASRLIFENLESNGTLEMQVPGLLMQLSAPTRRIFVGSTPSSDSYFGKFNISSVDNGIYIRTNATGNFGLSIRSFNATDNAIQVMGTTGTTRNFSVKANGEVYARKYTTTLGSIPDYVFDPSYKLMSFSELRTYLTTNRHLPNVPSAKEYTETGVDLGEMNRILLEKTEELTLYILQLEERLKALEEKP